MEAWFSHTSDVPIVIASVSEAINRLGILYLLIATLAQWARSQ